jgi:hypothetical protein
MCSLCRWLWAWWRADRVRASPREGRLLSLRPPCILLVRGRGVRVLESRPHETASGPCLVHHCLAEGAPCALRVTPRDGGTELLWVEGGRARILGEEEVEVFQPDG